MLNDLKRITDGVVESQDEVSKRWLNRRYMAWLSLLTMYAAFWYAVVAIPAGELALYQPLYGTLFTFAGGIVVGYFGAATYDDTTRKTAETNAKVKIAVAQATGENPPAAEPPKVDIKVTQSGGGKG